MSDAELAAGSEVLVLDADPKVRAGLEQLLADAGLAVTALGDEGQARALVGDKFFSVVIIDLDTPAPGAGLVLVSDVKERSPASAVVVLTARKVFESAVRAFRAGAADIIPKAPDQVEYVRHRVLELANESRIDLDRRKLLVEAREVHEEFLRHMMETARNVIRLEDKISGRVSSVSASDAVATAVLVVDEDPGLHAMLKAQLSADQQWWRLRHVATGGEALDVASNEVVHIALVRETLPDLPGMMVVHTLNKSSPQTLAVVYSPKQGTANVVDDTRHIPLEWGDERQIVGRVQELREGLRAKTRERRYLQAFRTQHYDFLRRYAELKQKLAKALKE